MKSFVKNNPPIFDISKSEFTQKDLKNFQKEVTKAVKFGLFPFAAEFKISKLENNQNNSSFSLICKIQGKYGDSDAFDIKAGDIFNFSFVKNDKYFSEFSTNISSQLFTILMICCPKTSQKLFSCLKNTDYKIAQKQPETIRKYLKKFFADQKTADELIAYIFENIDEFIHSKTNLERNFDEIFKAVFSRSNDIEVQDLKDPLNPKRCEYVAKYELIPQLIESGIFTKLPENPTIIDVGSGNGINILAIKTYFPNCTIFGIEPRKSECIKANKMGILTYQGFTEDLPQFFGKADLVTVFNSNPRSNASEFYEATAKLLKESGQAIIGVNTFDSVINSNGKTILENLSKYFTKVQKLPNPQNFLQDFYIAK